MEENNVLEKKKNNVGLIIIVVALLLICVGLGGLIFINKDKIFGGNEPKQEEQGQTENQNLKITEEVKERLNKFVDAGSNHVPSGSNETAENFREGTTTIPDVIKIHMAKLGTKTEWKEYNSEEAKSIGIEGVGPNKESIGVLKVSDFNKTYEEFFGEKLSDPIQALKSIKSCPIIWYSSNTNEEVYLLSRCGGTSDIVYTKEITSYDSDNEYYYVHQTLKYDRHHMNNGNYESTGEITTYKIVWKFDKDFKFISTTKED